MSTSHPFFKPVHRSIWDEWLLDKLKEKNLDFAITEKISRIERYWYNGYSMSCMQPAIRRTQSK